MLTPEDNKINLNALKNQDPFATKILDTALRVAVYKFVSKKNEWKKLDVEGSLFLFERMVEPLHSFVVMNTLALHLFLQPITHDLEFQDRNPFLLYKTNSDIYGIWFIDSNDCERVKSLLINLTAQAKMRKEKQQRGESTASIISESNETSQKTVKNDIMKMLSKAQTSYQLKRTQNTTDCNENPKEISNWSHNDYNNMVKPEPIRVQTTLDTSSSSCTSTEIKPQQQQQQINPIIQRLLSNDTNTQPININDNSTFNTHELISLDLKRKLNIVKDESNKSYQALTNSAALNINLLNMNGHGNSNNKNLITVKDFEENLLNESNKPSKAPTPRGQETMFYLEDSSNQSTKQQLNRPTHLIINDSKTFTQQQQQQHRSSFSESSQDSLNSPILPLLLTPAAFETCSQLNTNNFFTNGTSASSQSVAAAAAAELLLKSNHQQQQQQQLPSSTNISEINVNVCSKTVGSLLTKAQLQYLLIDLLKNDDKFTQSLHDAYLQSCLQNNLKITKD